MGPVQILHEAPSTSLHRKRCALSKLVVVGCGETNVNTGKNNGVVRSLEIFIGHKLHWVLCLLHNSELPLRASSPQQFSGTTEKFLGTWKTLAVVGYAPIPDSVPEIDKNTSAVSSGECPPDLANMSPAKMALSRWITTANIILHLYILPSKPPDYLNFIAEYVTIVNAPSWFEIKGIRRATYGACHLHRMTKKIVHEVIHRGTLYFAQSENIIWAMLENEPAHIRELGLRRILKARKIDWQEKILHVELPKLNFEVKERFKMIGWDNPSEPPAIDKEFDQKQCKFLNMEAPLPFSSSREACEIGDRSTIGNMWCRSQGLIHRQLNQVPERTSEVRHKAQ
ncbi:hypothetical protein PR048_006806, partial [Dryococelus australis]